MNVRFSVLAPIGVVEPPADFQSPGAVRELAAALERSGASACFVTDHPAPSHDWLHAHGHDAPDPFTGLAFIAAQTTRIMVHTHIVVLPYRNPFITAKAAATLQVLSGDRLILGVGAGYQKTEFDAVGADFSRRGDLTDEAIETLRLAWAGGKVVKRGREFDAIGNEPRPAPSPAPRIWVGGSSPRAIERAALLGDGWSPFFSAPTLSEANRSNGITSVAQLKEKIELIRELRAGAGRSDPYDVCIGPSYSPTERTRSAAERYLTDVGELAGVGVDWITANLAHPSRAEYLENLQWFSEDVIARA